ncbi:hypothetical protein EJ08DRAFT_662200 [Tothia fuscella]|uniref:Uncharacterized protein n=1 Tax=Tothia fuscella TaxID=1048955 RepID=A0A9P4TX35_9PEZI|nr:hypothetical protein EJ08DRAFT_662200 [Tothia fuscella]
MFLNIFSNILRDYFQSYLFFKAKCSVLSLHHVKSSFLAFGFDDFFWTSNTLVDTYQGETEPDKSTYFTAFGSKGLDPATGVGQSLEYPYWNPREYFLAAGARCLRQATIDWRDLIQAFDLRVVSYLENISCFDNPKLRTEFMQDHLPTILAIEEFTSALSDTIIAWQTFVEVHSLYFQTDDHKNLKEAIQSPREKIGKYLNEMETF